jgi:hypothetical protein
MGFGEDLGGGVTCACVFKPFTERSRFGQFDYWFTQRLMIEGSKW